VVEVDELRTTLHGWQEELSSRLVARDLAVAVAREHLAAGDTVVVPQYLGRPDFVVALEELADEEGATFTHVVLSAPADVLVARFRRRRAELRAGGASHPEADLGDDAVEAAIADAVSRLDAMTWRRGVVVVDAGGSVEDTTRALTDVLSPP
jgi:predicted kinase